MPALGPLGSGVSVTVQVRPPLRWRTPGRARRRRWRTRRGRRPSGPPTPGRCRWPRTRTRRSARPACRWSAAPPRTGRRPRWPGCGTCRRPGRTGPGRAAGPGTSRSRRRPPGRRCGRSPSRCGRRPTWRTAGTGRPRRWSAPPRARASNASMSRNCSSAVPGGPTLQPAAAAVGRAQDGAGRAGHPGHLVADRGEPPEARGDAGVGQLPGRLRPAEVKPPVAASTASPSRTADIFRSDLMAGELTRAAGDRHESNSGCGHLAVTVGTFPGNDPGFYCVVTHHRVRRA